MNRLDLTGTVVPDWVLKVVLTIGTVQKDTFFLKFLCAYFTY
jgi:hypothetical protein